jgi:hypothetical protein
MTPVTSGCPPRVTPGEDDCPRAFVTVDAAIVQLKRHGIIDADDYRVPRQAKPALPRHEHQNYG